MGGAGGMGGAAMGGGGGMPGLEAAIIGYESCCAYAACPLNPAF